MTSNQTTRRMKRQHQSINRSQHKMQTQSQTTRWMKTAVDQPLSTQDANTSADKDDTNTAFDEEDEPAVMSTHLIPLPRPNRLTTAEVLDLLQRRSPSVDVTSCIPHGTKNNVYCIIDNSRNADRCRNGLHNVFDDDCEAYKQAESLQQVPLRRSTRWFSTDTLRR